MAERCSKGTGAARNQRRMSERLLSWSFFYLSLYHSLFYLVPLTAFTTQLLFEEFCYRP